MGLQDISICVVILIKSCVSSLISPDLRVVLSPQAAFWEGSFNVKQRARIKVWIIYGNPAWNQRSQNIKKFLEIFQQKCYKTQVICPSCFFRKLHVYSKTVSKTKQCKAISAKLLKLNLKIQLNNQVIFFPNPALLKSNWSQNFKRKKSKNINKFSHNQI